MSRPANAYPGGHIPALDGVRGLAILWVILHNASDVLPGVRSGLLWLYAVVAHPGWIGVQLFFVLSGYLITTGLLETQQSPTYFKNFYVKRVLRIFPLYYAVLIGLLVLTPFLYPRNELHSTLLNELQLWTFVNNWTGMNLNGFTHFWSLAVEEQFYLVWPLLVLRRGPRSLFKLCLGLALAAFVIRCALVATGASSDALYNYTVCRMDALALGAAGAALMHLGAWPAAARASLPRAAMISVLLLAVTGLITRGFDRDSVVCETVGFTVLAATGAVLVTGAALAKLSSSAPLLVFLRWPLLRSCGKYSYAMYVLHFPVHKLLGVPLLKSLAPHGASAALVVVYTLVLICVSYALGALSYHGLEKHFLRLKPGKPAGDRSQEICGRRADS
jgi:peptidoglycan/LPS O-acetylase OafA/YrhL